MKSQLKHPWCKKVATKNLKKDQSGWSRPPVVDEIEFFEYDDLN